jgi:hypothetical protein
MALSLLLICADSHVDEYAFFNIFTSFSGTLLRGLVISFPRLVWFIILFLVITTGCLL